MNRSDVVLLFDHLFWMRDRVLDAGDHPSVDFATAAASTQRDLRATLVHELDVEWSWRVRLQRDDPTAFAPDDRELEPPDFPTLASLRDRWATDEAETRAWVAGLVDEDLVATCRAEPDATHPFWFHLQHLYTHGMQQLSDAASILSTVGRSPGELDFLEFVEDRLGR
jgi:uncharacterized damage-inducible protein DinB